MGYNEYLAAFMELFPAEKAIAYADFMAGIGNEKELVFEKKDGSVVRRSVENCTFTYMVSRAGVAPQLLIIVCREDVTYFSCYIESCYNFLRRLPESMLDMASVFIAGWAEELIGLRDRFGV